MTLQKITASEAKRLIDKGALLIDIRGADEHARESIPGARNCPVTKLETLRAGAGPVVFYCRTGNRTAVNSGRLATGAGCEAYAIEGGLEAWKQAGLPVRTDRSQPIEIQRQVQLVAGSLVLLGVLLGVSYNPAFFALAVLCRGRSRVCGTVGLVRHGKGLGSDALESSRDLAD